MVSAGPRRRRRTATKLGSQARTCGRSASCCAQAEITPTSASSSTHCLHRCDRTLDAALSIFVDPRRAAFRGALGRAGDHFSHYPEPGRKELRRALAAFARDNHGGELWLDRDLRRSRVRWADDVAAQLFVRAEGEDPTPIMDFTTELRDLALKLIRLLVAITKVYFGRLPEGVVVRVPEQ